MGFAKIFIIYMAISLALAIGTYDPETGVNTTFSQSLTEFMVVSGLSENVTVAKGTNLTKAVGEMGEEGGWIQETWWGKMYTGMKAAFALFKVLLFMWWIPVDIAYAIQAPWPIVLIIAILPFTFLIYLVAWIRGAAA